MNAKFLSLKNLRIGSLSISGDLTAVNVEPRYATSSYISCKFPLTSESPVYRELVLPSDVPFIEYLNITNDRNNVMKFMLPVV